MVPDPLTPEHLIDQCIKIGGAKMKDQQFITSLYSEVLNR
jgi:hypothetical protein